MKVNASIKYILALVVLLCANSSFAAQKSVPLPGDNRLRAFTYQPNTVFEYTGFLKYAARIDFDPKEKFLSITMGDPTGWQISPQGSTIFLKPTEVDAVTNMVIITNKRTYYFEMYSKEASAIDDPELVFATKFNYTDSNTDANNSGFMDLSGSNGGAPQEKSYVPDVNKDRAMLNMKYSMSGSKDISPLEVFDDGEFTYFKFKDINADYPAIFQVLPDGNEALINFRVSPEGYVVVEMVTSQFTLRMGSQMACVFNETKPLERIGKKKSNTSFFGIF